MNPAMATVAQTPPKPAQNLRKLGVPRRLSATVKLLIVAVWAAAGPNAQAQMPLDLVRSVADAGSRLVAERDNYTYTQRFRFTELRGGLPAGRYEEVRDITFTGTGERQELHRTKPIMQLQRMRLTDEDFRDLRDVNPFVLTRETLRFYKVGYKGIEQVDGLDCHVLAVRPKQVLYGQRFFDGLLWVGVEHGQVVRAGGRPVPQIHRIEDSNLFPAFITDYQPIDGKHWFPVRTEGDDILPFPTGNQRVKVLIEYSDYKRFSATSTVTFGKAPGEASSEREPVPKP